MARLTTIAWIGAATLWLAACGGTGPNQEAEVPSSGTDSPGESVAEEGAAEGSDSTNRTGKPQPPPVGTQNLDRRQLSMEFGLTLLRDDDVAAGVQTGTWSFEEERTHRVKAVGGNAVAELEVVYGKWEAKPLLGLVYEVPTDGKTYVVKAGDGDPSVTRAKQEPMTSAELEAVMGEYGYVGGTPVTLKALGAVGEQPAKDLEVDSSFIRAIMGAIPGVNLDESEMTAKFVGIDDGSRKTAKLELTLTATLRSGETEFKFDLKGPAAIDMMTGWVNSVTLEGPLHPGGKVKVGKKVLNARGNGSVKFTRSATFK